ncbi:MAG: hypothetical protein EHM58_09780 [Ignavibacteriae bacterium]|nr:MAG: hypothetical protein EHM58_09780 [Ignavibacteriota bacterium]
MSNNNSFQNLLLSIRSKSISKSRFVIALSGFGGSGKSTVANKLADVLKNAVIIKLDDFIINRISERSEDWNGFDWSRLTKQVLKPVHAGKNTIHYDVYDWNENKITHQKQLQLLKYIIIEGIGLLRNELKHYFDFSIWLDVPLDESIERGKKRDKEKYNVNHDELWDNIWGPNDNNYFKKHKPLTLTDYLLKNN